MHLYEIISGRWTSPEGQTVGFGYSGSPEGKNDPTKQDIPFVGPIPIGRYTIEQPRDTVTHGPYALPLVPDPSNQMFGRDSFLIHGDSKSVPGSASEGCIILARDVREFIWKSCDLQLEVVSGLPELLAQSTTA